LKVLVPLGWNFYHVEGHQDNTRALNLLDKWGKLNVQADKSVKEFISEARRLERYYSVPYPVFFPSLTGKWSDEP
jgi:hypothetical protein